MKSGAVEEIEYVPQVEAITHCPACNSARIVVAPHLGHSACIDCRMAWENIPDGEEFKIDGELLAFDRCCDNCAFRKHSDERADAESWQALQLSLASGGEFFCHKGVPFELRHDGKPHEFQYPKKPDGSYDRERMRLCRGYLASQIGPVLRKYAAEAAK